MRGIESGRKSRVRITAACSAVAAWEQNSLGCDCCRAERGQVCDFNRSFARYIESIGHHSNPNRNTVHVEAIILVGDSGGCRAEEGIVWAEHFCSTAAGPFVIQRGTLPHDRD